MNKSELIDEVFAEVGTMASKRAVEECVNVALAVIMHWTRIEKVTLAGFGSFESRERAPRVARNPITGEPVHIPARTVPVFKPATAFKAKVAN